MQLTCDFGQMVLPFKFCISQKAEKEAREEVGGREGFLEVTGHELEGETKHASASALGEAWRAGVHGREGWSQPEVTELPSMKDGRCSRSSLP